MSEKYRATKSQKQDDAHKRIGGKERRVQPAQIIGPYQRVLVNQQRAGGDYSDDGQGPQLRQ